MPQMAVHIEAHGRGDCVLWARVTMLDGTYLCHAYYGAPPIGAHCPIRRPYWWRYVNFCHILGETRWPEQSTR
jgi:hypothetical protein